jgi:hypothetical protein
MPGSGTVRTRPRIGAFFDMDKTLIAENSGSLWMKHRYENGEIGNLDLLKGIAVYLQYKLGVLDIRSWAQTALADYRGKREDEMEKVAREWFDTAIAPALYPEAAALVRTRRPVTSSRSCRAPRAMSCSRSPSGSASATCSTRDSRSSAAASRAA